MQELDVDRRRSALRQVPQAVERGARRLMQIGRRFIDQPCKLPRGQAGDDDEPLRLWRDATDGGDRGARIAFQ
ncbi:MAG: hypothetical protein ACLQFF_07195 [Steroidobacteraceae bacterium]